MSETVEQKDGIIIMLKMNVRSRDDQIDALRKENDELRRAIAQRRPAPSRQARKDEKPVRYEYHAPVLKNGKPLFIVYRRTE